MTSQISPLLAVSLFLALPAVASAQGPINEDQKFVAPDASMFARFGIANAVGGNHLLIGAGLEGSNGSSAGAAYLFDRTTNQFRFKLLPAVIDVGDRFGNTVAIDGDTVLIGAWGENGDDNGSFQTDSGQAYIFSATTGQQLFTLRASDSLSHARFGRSVSLSGNLAAIGSNGLNQQLVETGAAYVFDAAAGLELTKLLATDGTLDDRLGEAVAIHGELVVAGAVGVDDNGEDSGAAYVFHALTGVQLAKLMPADGEAGDRFGYSVAIAGDRIAVSTVADDDNGPNSGSVYIFDAGTGQELLKLVPSDGATFDEFGHSVAISGSRVVVGSHRDDDLANSSGSVYVFDLFSGQELAKLLPSDGAENHGFGYHVALDGNTLLAGSPFSSDGFSLTGSAYRFDLDDFVVSYCPPNSGNSVSINGALLTSAAGFGTAQATFNLAGVPDTFGLLFAGDSATDVALGCGRLCVGGTIVRGPVVMPSGNVLLGVPFDMSPAGTTHVQYWYRDSGTCTSASDLSNALTQ